MWFQRRPRPESVSPEALPQLYERALLFEVDGELAQRLRQAARVQDQPPEALAADLLARGLELEAREAQAWRALSSLTRRERQVAQFIARGYTNRQIAAALVVSPETVKTHVRHALEKLGVRSKAELRLRLAEIGAPPWSEDMPSARRAQPYSRGLRPNPAPQIPIAPKNDLA